MAAERKIFIPREYQDLSAGFILDTPRCMLAAPPGFGKTSIVYLVLDILKLAGSNFFPALVVAPKNVAKNVWTNEGTKWDRFEWLKVRTITGTREQRLAAMRAPKADVYTINYENLEWLIRTLGPGNWPFKIVIADESTKLKNFRMSAGAAGVRSQALSHVVQETGRWVNLSGTPAPNGLKDLWGQFWFVDFGARLGRTYTAYMDKWFLENKYTRKITMREDADTEIHERLADVMLALRVEDWFDIDKPVRTVKSVTLPPEARAAYDEMERQFFVEWKNTPIEAFNAGAKSQKLLELASGSIYDEHGTAHEVHDAKNEVLQELVDELQEPLMVVYWWKFDAPRIKKAFPHARIYRGEQDRLDWQAGKIDMLLLNPAEGGHGLDFQDGGRAICHYSQIWDAELRTQVNERIGPVRQFQSGHDRGVLEYYLVAQGTVDEEAVERVDGKISVQDALMLARSRRH